ncbi:hypothetical protein [Paraburkholderia sp. BL25I1N1]|uniref:hypothetical protein n=1 Tax=Paraburkholderia sp. BL25I1N1 TaxID=1938804 RepID=UPI000D062202|nr:hypothetical protein [Paraburkholderia sp. BL25I1N1]PRY03405.1 hypothetical protein B0G73_1159 [Paraburkholderia sp. BL25I1N1]
MQSNRPNEEPALILTFYGPSGSLGGIFKAAEAWREKGFFTLDDVMFLPPQPAQGAHDAELMQVALNGKGDVESVWPLLYRRAAELIATMDATVIWGYTSVYHAYVRKNTVADAIDRMIPFALPLSGGRTAPTALAQDVSASSALCLLSIALDGTPREIENTYMAVTESDATTPIWSTDSLFGYKALLVSIDLLAHKAYWQIRQYREPRWLAEFERQLAEMESSARDLLKKQSSSGFNTLIAPAAAQVRRNLAVLQEFELLQVSIMQQEQNLSAYRDEAVYGSVATLHLNQMNTAVRELEFFVRKSRIVREHANFSIEASRAMLANRGALRQSTYQNVLAAMAATFAVPQLVDRTLAKEFLVELRAANKPEAVSDFAAFGLQVGVIAVFIVVAILVMRRLHVKF